jgi:CRP-like cAMP-binding protein
MKPFPLLEALSEDQRHLLERRSCSLESSPGDYLIVGGDEPIKVFLLLDGLVKLVAYNQDGNQSIVGLAGAGDVVGLAGALDGDWQPVDAIAIGRCTSIAVETEQFLRVVLANPVATDVLVRALARNVRWLYDTAMERSRSSGSERMAIRILELAELAGQPSSNGIRIDPPVPQRDLAALAGMCRESANKTIGIFKRAGAIDYEGRTLRVLRPDVLKRFTCAGRGAEPFL